MLDSRLEYVVRGERGAVNYLGLGTQSGATVLRVASLRSATSTRNSSCTTSPRAVAGGQRTFVVLPQRAPEAPNWLRLASGLVRRC